MQSVNEEIVNVLNYVHLFKNYVKRTFNAKNLVLIHLCMFMWWENFNEFKSLK
jgi:hypothetical protein